MIKLVFLSSILFVLSFPDISFFPGVFCFLIPLLALFNRKEMTVPRAFSAGLLWTLFSTAGTAFFIFHAVMIHYEKSFFTALFFFLFALVLPYGIIYGAFTSLMVFFRQKRKVAVIILPPALWVLIEYFIEILPFTIPWASLSQAAVSWSAWAQIADLTGPHGLTFLIVLANSLAYFIIASLRERDASLKHFMNLNKSETGAVVLLVAVLVFPAGYGIIRGTAFEKPASTEARAFIVQGNFSQQERWRGSFNRRISTYARLTEEALTKTDNKSIVVLWPETVLNNPEQTTPELFARLAALLPEEAALISGGVRNKGRKLFNTAWVLNPASLSWYDKQILLPFGETGEVFPFLGTYYQAPSRFEKGRGKKTVSTDAGRAGLSICFEAVYPKHVRRAVKEGALFLVNISNDAWFGPRVMPRLHLNIARLRAIENRRYLLRASNSGISAIIGPRGETIAESRLFNKEVIKGSFYPLNNQTLYTRSGDWPVFFSVLILALMLIDFIRRSPDDEA